jgi:hypothetical protein
MCVFIAGGVISKLLEVPAKLCLGPSPATWTLRNALLFKKIYMNNLEIVVQIFESQPSLHATLVLSHYVKPLVSLDWLDESLLLKTLQRGSVSATTL